MFFPKGVNLGREIVKNAFFIHISINNTYTLIILAYVLT